MTQTDVALSFDTLGLASSLLEVLKQHNYIQPTPIQYRSLPIALEGQDMVGIAQTGTGKTLAFGLPMIQRLAILKAQGLVLAPTRELAFQIDETLQKIGRPLGLRTAVVVGGASMHQQIQRLRQKCHIIVATPGRLMDHLKQKTISLDNIKMVVLDEADRMFDIGFAPQITQILSLLPQERQTMLFSATMPKEISLLASKFMNKPQWVEVAPAGTTAAKVEQIAYLVAKDAKIKLLNKLLAENEGTVLVFSRTKFGSKRIAAAVRDMKHTAAEIHSNKSLAQRRNALQGFKNGQYRILVATDIAARGIDVKDISLVINYDLPDNPEDYVHRIGRTGRAGSNGNAITFVEPERKSEVRRIERLIRKELSLISHPEFSLPQRNISNTSNFEQKRPFKRKFTPRSHRNSGRRQSAW